MKNISDIFVRSKNLTTTSGKRKKLNSHFAFPRSMKFYLSSSSRRSSGTQSELAPSSDRAERHVDGSHPPSITIRHHSINMTVRGGDPEALEHHSAAKTVFLFFVFQTIHPRVAPNGFQ